MIDTLAKIVEQFGIPLAMVALLAWFVVYMAKSHKSERAEWRGDAVRMQGESNQVMRDLTRVITEANIRNEPKNK